MSEQATIKGWHDLLVEYHAAKTAADNFVATSLDPFERAQKVMFPNWPDKDSPELARLKEWNIASGYQEVSDRHEQMVDHVCALADELVRRPAPDAKAALWKFRHLYTEDAGTAWEPDFIRQANIDIFRFLENAQ